LLVAEGQESQAIAYLQRAVHETDPLLAFARDMALGRALTSTGAYADATSAYRGAATHQPQSQLARIGLATALLMGNRPTDAAVAAQNALASGGEHEDIRLATAFQKADARFVQAWIGRLQSLVGNVR
jgi:cytochrome c-type biogenesis protein CcmH/NrfG